VKKWNPVPLRNVLAVVAFLATVFQVLVLVPPAAEVLAGPTDRGLAEAWEDSAERSMDPGLEVLPVTPSQAPLAYFLHPSVPETRPEPVPIRTEEWTSTPEDLFQSCPDPVP
jgi:hypothetical protein